MPPKKANIQQQNAEFPTVSILDAVPSIYSLLVEFSTDMYTVLGFTKRAFGRLPISCFFRWSFPKSVGNMLNFVKNRIANRLDWSRLSPLLPSYTQLQVRQTVCLWEYAGNNNSCTPHPLYISFTSLEAMIS